MTATALTPEQVWLGRPVIDGHQPDPIEIVRLLNIIVNGIQGAQGGLIVFDTKANLDADLAHDAGTLAFVYNDAAISNRTIYRKTGASGAGSWSAIPQVAQKYIPLSNAGAGTGNAIQLTSELALPANAYGGKFLAEITHANTGAATISINGATARPLVTRSGSPLQSDYLTVGSAVEFVDDGTNYRLTSDIASAAIQAAAEAAQVAAESAAGANLANMDSRAAAILATIPGSVNYVRTAGWAAPGDGGGALYKRAAGATPGGFQDASGSWWEYAEFKIRVRAFGATGDGSEAASAFQDAVDLLEARVTATGNGGIIWVDPGTYLISSAIDIGFSGCKIHGAGSWAVRINVPPGIFAFDAIADVNGNGAAWGQEIVGIGFWSTVAKPSSGAMIRWKGVHSGVIKECLFHSPYLGIYLTHCQGDLVKLIDACDFIAPATSGSEAGSACIFVEGDLAAGGTGITHRLHIRNCTGGGIGMEYGLRVTGVDVLHLTGNHLHGFTAAPLALFQTTTNVWNIVSAGNVWEALPDNTGGGANYACIISGDGASFLSQMQFTDTFMNGAVCSTLISGNGPNDIQFTGSKFIQSLSDGVRIDDGDNISFIGCHVIDIDINNNGSRSYFVVGATGAPNNVRIAECRGAQKFFMVPQPNIGIDVRAGTNIELVNSDFPDATKAIESDVSGATILIKNVRGAANFAIISSAAPVSVPLGVSIASITGSNDVSVIADTGGDNSASIDREITLRNESALNYIHGTPNGGLVLASGANWAAPAGSYLTLKYFADSRVWFETGRAPTS